MFAAFNIDARLNAAYVVLGLLYGNGDMTKTIAISTRAGQDSDCNPSSAAGILGTMLGYSKIPAYWTQGLAAIEAKPFPFAGLSLNDAYALSLKHALAQIRRDGGAVARRSRRDRHAADRAGRSSSRTSRATSRSPSRCCASA